MTPGLVVFHQRLLFVAQLHECKITNHVTNDKCCMINTNIMHFLFSLLYCMYFRIHNVSNPCIFCIYVSMTKDAFTSIDA